MGNPKAHISTYRHTWYHYAASFTILKRKIFKRFYAHYYKLHLCGFLRKEKYNYLHFHNKHKLLTARGNPHRHKVNKESRGRETKLTFAFHIVFSKLGSYFCSLSQRSLFFAAYLFFFIFFSWISHIKEDRSFDIRGKIFIPCEEKQMRNSWVNMDAFEVVGYQFLNLFYSSVAFLSLLDLIVKNIIHIKH